METEIERPELLQDERIVYHYSDGSAEEKRVVRLGRKRTELGWTRWLDSVALRLMPHWFNLLQWILVIGAFQYLGEKSRSFACAVIVAVSLMGLFYYLVASFDRYHFADLPWANTSGRQRFVSVTIATGMAAAVFWTTFHLARLLAENT